MKNKIYIMVAASGAGKSTFASFFKGEMALVSSDGIREELTGSENDLSKDGYLWKTVIPERIEKSLESGDVLFDATNYSKKNRSFLQKYNVPIIALWIKTDLEKCKENNMARTRNVPEFVIERQYNQLDKPEKGEFAVICEVKEFDRAGVSCYIEGDGIHNLYNIGYDELKKLIDSQV